MIGKLVFGGMIGAIAGIVIYVNTRDEPSRVYERPLPPPVAGAFKSGGVPLRDPAFEKFLVGPFTDFVLAVDRDRSSFGRNQAARDATAEAVVAAQPTWTELVATLTKWVPTPISSPEFDTIAADIRTRARVISDGLAAAGSGYYLEGSVFGGGDAAHAVIYSYRVEEVVFLTANGKPRRVLSLRRLDNMNLSHGLLGMESESLGDPIVLLDQIDKHVASYILPALAPHASFPTESTAPIQVAAGDAIRREIAAALGADATAATYIGTLLRERAQIVAAWTATLEARGWHMPETRDLFLPAPLLDQLEATVSRSELARVRTIDDELAQLEIPRIASRVHDLVVRTVRHHEAEHGLDDDRSSKLAYPEVLADHVGSFENRKGEPRPAAEHANAELSAYTSQIANDLVTPQLAVWSLAQHAFERRAWGTVESYVAVIVIEGLARHLAGGKHEPIIHDGIIDLERLADVALALPTRSGAELRAAAQALYRDLYGEPCPAITD